jgi:hypothetical protein
MLSVVTRPIMLIVIMQSVIMLSVVILSVVMLSVVMLNVVANPLAYCDMATITAVRSFIVQECGTLIIKLIIAKINYVTLKANAFVKSQ